MKAPDGWCEPAATTIGPNITTPMSIPSCETVDESNIPTFLRDNLEISDPASEKDWRGDKKASSII